MSTVARIPCKKCIQVPCNRDAIAAAAMSITSAALIALGFCAYFRAGAFAHLRHHKIVGGVCWGSALVVGAILPLSLVYFGKGPVRRVRIRGHKRFHPNFKYSIPLWITPSGLDYYLSRRVSKTPQFNIGLHPFEGSPKIINVNTLDQHRSIKEQLPARYAKPDLEWILEVKDLAQHNGDNPA